jgi:hypothetical protein
MATKGGFIETGVAEATESPYGPGVGGWVRRPTGGMDFVDPGTIGRLWCLVRKPLRPDPYSWPVPKDDIVTADARARAALTSDYWGNGPKAPLARRGYLLWGWWRANGILARVARATRVVGLMGTAWRDRLRKFRGGLPPRCW